MESTLNKRGHGEGTDITRAEVEALRERLREAEDTLRSIRDNEVDALVISVSDAEQVITLQTAERPYRILIEQMQEGALTLSHEGVILYSNHGFARILKRPLETLVGKLLSEFAAPGDIPALEAILRDGKAGSGKGEINLWSSNQELVPVYLSATALKEDSSNPLGIIITDLTEQKRGEQIVADEKLARAILEYVSIALVVCDRTGRVVRVSQSGRELAGGAVLNHRFLDAFNLETDIASQLAQTLTGATFDGLETRLLRPDGRAFDLMVSAGPLRGPNNAILGFIVALTDITDRKRIETDLQTNQQNVESLNQRLQRSMSETHHRVKNNLQVIISLVNMQLMEHPETVPAKELLRLTHHIKALATIHDLMTFQAKNDAELNDIDVREMVERYIPIVRSMMTDDRKLTLEVEELRIPIRYITAVAVVLNELISNSVKHGEGTISVRITRRNDVACLEISDEGKGFAPGFNPETSSNTGLELLTSLVQWDLQGAIRYSNNPTGGACVHVEFPIGEAEKNFPVPLVPSAPPAFPGG